MTDIKRSEVIYTLQIIQKNITMKTQNKPYKVPSVIVHVKKKCSKIEPEQYQSIDEQIVPAKLVLVE